MVDHTPDHASSCNFIAQPSLLHKTAVTALLMALLGLTACSSSSGDGAPPPRDVTVVVPPSSTTSP